MNINLIIQSFVVSGGGGRGSHGMKEPDSSQETVSDFLIIL